MGLHWFGAPRLPSPDYQVSPRSPPRLARSFGWASRRAGERRATKGTRGGSLVGEAAELDGAREGPERVGPGPLLAGGGVEAVEGEERVLQVPRDPVLHRPVNELRRRP